MKIKIILRLLTIILLINVIMNFTYTNTYARTFSINKAALYSKGKCKKLIKKSSSGAGVEVSKIFYKSNGKEYPAYCINMELDGVGEAGSYSVSVNKVVSNELVRRVMLNGYPYKSVKSLGLNSVDEAYTATKLAVYCVLYNFDKNNFKRFGAVGTAGKRTFNAMKKIVKTARSSKDKYKDPNINIKEVDKGWKTDEKNDEYISKKFKATSTININKFTLKIENNTIKNIKITDLNNKEKTTFTGNSEFKVLIPIKEITEDGKFEIKINGQVDTKPILYGKAPNSKVQNYALAGITYENAINNAEVNYKKEDTTIIVEKIDEDSKETLTGAIFNIYDENKEIIYENMEVDKDGKLILKGVLPGKYYIEEVKAPEGYKKLDEQIEIEINYAEEKEVKISNTKIKVKIEKEVEEKEPKKPTIKRLPITGY